MRHRSSRCLRKVTSINSMHVERQNFKKRSLDAGTRAELLTTEGNFKRQVYSDYCMLRNDQGAELGNRDGEFDLFLKG